MSTAVDAIAGSDSQTSLTRQFAALSRRLVDDPQQQSPHKAVSRPGRVSVGTLTDPAITAADGDGDTTAAAAPAASGTPRNYTRTAFIGGVAATVGALAVATGLAALERYGVHSGVALLIGSGEALLIGLSVWLILYFALAHAE